MKSTKIKRKACKEYKDCKKRDGQGPCPLRVWMKVINQLLGG